MDYTVKYLGGTFDDPRFDTIEFQKAMGIENDAQIVRFIDFNGKTMGIIPLERVIAIYVVRP